MCGISGSWERVPNRSFSERLRAGLEKVRHRGPDDVGVFELELDGGARVGLGSMRLAILDLTPAGHMPMESADGRHVVSFNGEITNYIEIREELVALGCRFRSNTDTEVLLQAWAIWGQSSLERFEGMYAFVVLDKEKKTLTLVRDVFGIKPLFYAYEPGASLTFCSELPALLAMRVEKPHLSWQTAIDYLQWGTYDGSPNTFVEGVNQLMPAHFVTLDLTTGHLDEPRRYWWPSVDTDTSITIGEATETVRELFLQSVRRNLRSDVPVGVALSGGIDSSAIVSSIRHLEPNYPLQVFSFISPGFAESEHEWIDRVVEATRAQPYSVSSTGAGLLQDLDAMILAQGEPFGTTSIYAQYKVFQKVREQGVVVTLDGQGADEMFAGYMGYPGSRLHSLIETGKWGQARRFLEAWSEWPNRTRGHAVREATAQFVPQTLSRFMEAMRPGQSPIIDYVKLRERNIRVGAPRLPSERGVRGRRVKDQLRTQLLVRGLPALLRHGDRNSMHFSVESRVPFLDRTLVKYALSLPEHYLIGPDGTSKDIFRRAMRGIVPDVVLDRRDKIGFSTPQRTWLAELNSASSRTGEVAQGSEVGFMLSGAAGSSGLEFKSENELGLGAGSHWRLLNLRRWVSLLGIDAS